MAELAIREIDGGVVLMVKVVPGSSKTAVAGLLNGMLKVKVAAAAEKGKANQCLVELLAKQLGVKKGAVCIISGKTRPVKSVQVLGVSGGMLLTKLNLNG